MRFCPSFVFKGGCMARFREGLYSVQIESCVITLTLVSVLAITGELLINLHIVQVPETGSKEGEVLVNTSQGNESRSPNTTTGNPIDPGGGNSTKPLETAHLVFHYISLVIAAVFLAEIVLKMLAKGKSFFLKIFQVADALIVVGAFALEIVFTVEQEELPFLEATTYVIILRLWRVPYTCNIRAKEYRRELEIWRSAKYKLDERCKELQTKIDKQQDQVRDLERRLDEETNKDLPSAQSDKSTLDSDSRTEDRVPVANGHIPHVTSMDEENGNYVEREGKQLMSGEGHRSNGSVVVMRKKTKKHKTVVKHEHSNDSGAATETKCVETEASPDRGPFTRTDSESSLSCDHVEQEVVVQIEGVSPKRHLSTTSESANLLNGHPDRGSTEFSYCNATFEDEIGHQDLPVLHEIDGVKTYRSADGIPMTSL